MSYFFQFLFLITFIGAIAFFVINIKKVIRNIHLGTGNLPQDNKSIRWKKMARIALGQSKMVVQPIPGILHILVYLGFIIINIEVLEIIIDGIFGTHRIFSFLGLFYDFLIGSFEVLALIVIGSVFIFWCRRNIKKVKRFFKKEMNGWPKEDGNIILYIEFILMLLFLTMNGADYWNNANQGLELAGSFPISQHLFSFFQDFHPSTLHVVERTMWWLHILGILFFLNYLYYSKHFHILSAFPNVWYSKITPKAKLENLASVKKEVELMMNPEVDPFAASPNNENEASEKFGAQDIFDLNKVQLLNAYSCTECGRCTAECPANITGKRLSPRKIMMDTRDRIEEVSKNIDRNGQFKDDNKKLLGDYISSEEIWACTSCNACTEACPISIDPLSIIIKLRQFLVMEKSEAPMEINLMMQNVENKGTPWPFNNSDRLNWNN